MHKSNISAHASSTILLDIGPNVVDKLLPLKDLVCILVSISKKVTNKRGKVRTGRFRKEN